MDNAFEFKNDFNFGNNDNFLNNNSNFLENNSSLPKYFNIEENEKKEKKERRIENDNNYLHKPETRKILSDFFGIFNYLQEKLKQTNDEKDRKILIYNMSLRYRAGIGACVLDYIKANTIKGDCNGNDLDKTSKEFYQSYRTVLRWYHTIWFTAEISFLFPTNGSVTSQFKDLVGLADYPADEIDEIENDIEGKRDIKQIWKIAYRFVIQGQLTDALKMIEYAVYEEGKEVAIHFLEELEVLFKTFPTVQLTKTVNGTFVKERKSWLNKVESAILRFENSTSGILEVLKILSGEEALINEYAKHWFEIVLANMLYINTSIYLYDLPGCAENAWEIKKPTEDIEYHKILYYIITEKLQDFSSLARSLKPNNVPYIENWLLTHLCDLLHHSGSFDFDDLEESRRKSNVVRDSLLLNYSKDLHLSHNEWQFSLHYSSCVSPVSKNKSKKFMEEVIKGQSLSSQTKLLKLMSTCKKYGFDKLSVTLQENYALQKKEENNLEEAIFWLNSCGSKHLLSKIINEQSLDNLATLSYSFQATPFTENSSFVQLYKDYRSSIDKKDYTQAIKSLFVILDENKAPPKFFIDLFYDIIPILEKFPYLFTRNNIESLMAHLQKFLLFHDTSNHPNLNEDKKIETKIFAIRYSLTRNLARSYLLSK